MIRLVLAATLGASYGIYGPAFELCERAPIAARHRGVPRLREVPARALGPRRARTACATHRPRSTGSAARTRRCRPTAASGSSTPTTSILIATARSTPDGTNLVLMVVNLDPYHTRQGSSTFPIHRWGIAPGEHVPGPRPDRATRATSGGTGTNYVELNPFVQPAHDLPRPAPHPRSRRTSTNGREPATDATLVQGRDPLRGPRPRLHRLQRRTGSATSRASSASSTTCRTSASPRSGCCPSIRAPCATTATTSPTTPT